MRLHIGVAMARQGRYGQTAIIATEHQDIANLDAPIGTRPTRQYVVRAIIQTGPKVEVARDTLVAMVLESQRYLPCVFVDCGAGGGMSLYQSLRANRRDGTYPINGSAGMLHAPHPFVEVGRDRQTIIDAILTAYASDALFFQEGLPLRVELAKALAARNATVAEDGIISTSSDEAMVTALGLSIRHAMHGRPPNVLDMTGHPLPARLP